MIGITVDEAFGAFRLLAGYTPSAPPVKLPESQCAYCGKPLNDCGCGAKEARRIEPKRQRRIPVRPEPKTGTDW